MTAGPPPLTMWHGLGLWNLLRLLWMGLPVDRSGRSRILRLSGACLANSLLHLAERLVWERRIRRVQLHPEPIFILGHWRSGTTLLHNLLACDPQLAYVNCYQATFPGHFLLSERRLSRLLRRRLPAQRPMDNMPLAWDLPQEDEAALAVMTLLSPYLRSAFPDPPQAVGRLDHFGSGLTDRERERWQLALLRLMRKVALRHGSTRFVLKSPPHTARIPLLLELFPRARFVHVVRNPYEVYASTLRMRRAMAELNGFSREPHRDLEEHVLQTYQAMYQAYHMHKALIEPGRLLELTYEDLVADPLEVMRKLYRHFDLSGFAGVVPRLRTALADHGRYQTRTGPLPVSERQRVYQQWGMAFRRYGYPSDLPEDSPRPTTARPSQQSPSRP